MLIILFREPLAIIYLAAQQLMQIKAVLFKCVQGADSSLLFHTLKKKNILVCFLRNKICLN